MNYPTMEEVEKADRIQLCRWHRFLPSPGRSAIDHHTLGINIFQKVMDREKVILDRIEECLKGFGGFTPEISKLIGWEE